MSTATVIAAIATLEVAAVAAELGPDAANAAFEARTGAAPDEGYQESYD